MEQAALRQVATLVARRVGPELVFRAVAEAVGGLFGPCGLIKFEPDDTVTLMGAQMSPHTVGDRLRLDPGYVVDRVKKTGHAARFDTDDPAAPDNPPVVRELGIRSGLASPVVVDGELWGAITVGSFDRPLLAETEQRLAAFTDLLATAVSDAQARADLRRLADEQAALRRVATLIAENAPASELFSAVVREVGTLLGGDFAGIARFEDRDVVTVGVWARDREHPPVPPRWEMQEGDPATTVAQTRVPTRWDDWSEIPGPIAEFIRQLGVRCTVGAPIIVEGRLWGALALHSTQDSPLPADTPARLGQFTDLVATAIANAQARAEVERLADEQAALRRVATLVAEGAPATAVFDAVAAEMAGLLDADGVTLSRYEPDMEIVVVAHHGSHKLPLGQRLSHPGENVTSLVRRDERSARLERYEWTDAAVAELVAGLGIRASVGAPIVVEGRLWGVIIAYWRRGKSPPLDTEERLAKFAELLDTAIANADTRDQLTASRARLLTEADEARRRVVRDLHDGAQQRLVHSIISLKLAQRALRGEAGDAASLVDEALEQAEQGNVELRELAHGILPAVLTRGGLRAGVNAVVARIDLPVEVEVPHGRFPAEIEASAYFIVAEALTNVVKHAHAMRAEVTASVDDGVLHLEIRDDGIGGADPGGHGLVGIADRATALGGWLAVEGSEDTGTVVTAELPLRG